MYVCTKYQTSTTGAGRGWGGMELGHNLNVLCNSLIIKITMRFRVTRNSCDKSASEDYLPPLGTIGHHWSSYSSHV